jgi:hypothetical protein
MAKISTSEKIRKFERMLLLGKQQQTSKPVIRQVIGTFTYDFEKGTETYTPAKK